MFMFLAILVVFITFAATCLLTCFDREWGLDHPPRKASSKMSSLYVMVGFYLLAGIIAEQDLVVRVLSMAAFAIPAGILVTDWVFGPSWWRWAAPILRRQDYVDTTTRVDHSTRPRPI